MDAYIATAKNIALGGTLPKEFLDNLPKYADAFSRQSWANLEAALVQLGDASHTLGAVGILNAKAKSSDLSTNFDAFVVQLTSFIANADGVQLRQCPILIVEICQIVADHLTKRRQSIKGINLIIAAIKALQSHPRQLTSIHAILLELCLASHALKSALPFLVDDIDDFTSELRGSECKSLLLYFYYGGMVFASLKKFREAIYFFEACIRVPATTLSHVMLESYKKFVLVSLIQNGEVPQPPKTAAQVVNRLLKPTAPAYCDLTQAFSTHNPVDLTNAITRHQEVFRRDGNFGLVKQVKSAQTKINIQRLTKTFLTLSLADVAAIVQLPGGAQQAESYILSMINEAEIYAKINQRDGMVVFLDNKEKYDSPRMMQKIEKQIEVCVELNKRLGDMNERLAKNPDYISKVVLANEDEGISSSKLPSFNM